MGNRILRPAALPERPAIHETCSDSRWGVHSEHPYAIGEEFFEQSDRLVESTGPEELLSEESPSGESLRMVGTQLVDRTVDPST